MFHNNLNLNTFVFYVWWRTDQTLTQNQRVESKRLTIVRSLIELLKDVGVWSGQSKLTSKRCKILHNFASLSLWQCQLTFNIPPGSGRQVEDAWNSPVCQQIISLLWHLSDVFLVQFYNHFGISSLSSHHVFLLLSSVQWPQGSIVVAEE